MSIILLPNDLKSAETEKLVKEFPQYEILMLDEKEREHLGKSQWAKVEVLYTQRLSEEEFSQVSQLRWIHVPSSVVDQLCLGEIRKHSNILITTTEKENIREISEFAIGVILAFAKHLFHWAGEMEKGHSLVGASPWHESMWSLKNRTLLQVGLGEIGTEIAKKAKQLELKVWGVEQQISFHPYCHKTFTMRDLHSVLPAVDIVCLALPKDKAFEHLFRLDELELMKKDSILIVLGSSKVINESDLSTVVKQKKFRGVLLDISDAAHISVNSPLFHSQNILVTPGISSLPKSEESSAMQTFRYNLRQFIHGNFTDMKNLMTPHVARSESQMFP